LGGDGEGTGPLPLVEREVREGEGDGTCDDGAGEETSEGGDIRTSTVLDPVAVEDGPGAGEGSMARSSGSVSIGARAMRVRAWRRGCWGAERPNREGRGAGSESDDESARGGRAEKDLNEGVKRRRGE